ncbi:class I SAM-dependent methyltransferase [Gammaproteobacteria bacterium]|nr:class I SAM-dependent methyltransferase [Gammaproteobacteria bacterium]
MKNTRLKTTNEVNKVIDIASEKIRILLDSIDFSEQIRRNALYQKYADNRFHYYVEMEVNRYVKVLDLITTKLDPDRKMLNVCDYGCMLPILPTALTELGYNVTIVDKYEYYGDEFKNSVKNYCDQNNLKIFDLDILNDSFDIIEKSDISINLAVVEHLNGSPKKLINKIRNKTKEDGLFIFDVPNIANFVKRVRSLMGYSPLDDYNDYLNAPYPYMGHNREMTVSEVKALMSAASFSIQHIETYDFNPFSTITNKGKFIKALKPMIPMRHLGECILAISAVKK